MKIIGMGSLVRLAGALAVSSLLGACATLPPDVVGATRNQVIISVRDQKLTVISPDHHRTTFPISTSKFGLGDRRGSLATPLGEMEVAQKIGAGAPEGSVFRSRVRTGEIVKVDAPGRDAIVTRILALKGLEASNQGAFSRGIYIHGTPEERNLGRPVSYGCIRMRSKDVIQLFDMVGVGAHVQVIDTTMSKALAANIITPAASIPAPVAAIAKGTPTPPAAAPAAPPAAAPAAPLAAAAPLIAAGKPAAQVKAKSEWAGSPTRLLAREALAEARAAARKPRPVSGTRPISNPGGDANLDNGENSRALSRSAVDSL